MSHEADRKSVPRVRRRHIWRVPNHGRNAPVPQVNVEPNRAADGGDDAKWTPWLPKGAGRVAWLSER
jgi:hypothetical protein